ncbi:hypothetical protein [Synechococcus sp. CCY 0621]|uniref:hypothetical protein n=1 Tax=Synechococcus sp. CCY 0621 TaxID=2815603 RepID=UPI001C2463C0|nr:hypothetical protein [Synechococcus sp. CCY 0621]
MGQRQPPRSGLLAVALLGWHRSGRPDPVLGGYRPEIHRHLRWRRLHISAIALTALVFLAQGLTRPRDLLEMPLSWRKPTVHACDARAMLGSALAPAVAPAAP